MNQELEKAIREAYEEHGWLIGYVKVDQQEVGYGQFEYAYQLTITGQYAETDATGFFDALRLKNQIISVTEEYTEHSYCIITVYTDSE